MRAPFTGLGPCQNGRETGVSCVTHGEPICSLTWRTASGKASQNDLLSN